MSEKVVGEPVLDFLSVGTKKDKDQVNSERATNLKSGKFYLSQLLSGQQSDNQELSCHNDKRTKERGKISNESGGDETKLKESIFCKMYGTSDEKCDKEKEILDEGLMWSYVEENCLHATAFLSFNPDQYPLNNLSPYSLALCRNISLSETGTCSYNGTENECVPVKEDLVTEEGDDGKENEDTITKKEDFMEKEDHLSENECFLVKEDLEKEDINPEKEGFMEQEDLITEQKNDHVIETEDNVKEKEDLNSGADEVKEKNNLITEKEDCMEEKDFVPEKEDCMEKKDFVPEKEDEVVETGDQVTEKKDKIMENKDQVTEKEDEATEKDQVFEKEDSSKKSGGEKNFPSAKPRTRSGSNTKHNRGKRRRSRKHGNNQGGQCGGGGNGNSSDNGTTAAGGAGSSGGGDGDGNEERDRKQRLNSEITSEEEDESDNKDESDDENKAADDEGNATSTNLLPSSSVLPDKTEVANKDLTRLLSDDIDLVEQPTSANQAAGIFRWPDKDKIEHSCISMDDFAFCLGHAAEEDFVPRELDMNACLTTLLHNLGRAQEAEVSILVCEPCCALLSLLEHMPACEKTRDCIMCTQACNLVLHHSKICINNGRQRSPYSSTDLCFKLCRYANWNEAGLFGPNKINNKMTILKCCNKILTQPQCLEMCVSEESGDEEGNQVKPDTKGKIEWKILDKESPGVQNGFRSHSSTLTRKPSTKIRPIPPSIREYDENGEEEEQQTEYRKESAPEVLRKKYATNPEDKGTVSLSQGQLSDEPMGQRGVGEVEYGTVNQLNDIAKCFEQQKEDLINSRKFPEEGTEEGIILEDYKSKFHISGTRYQPDVQWEIMTALGRGMTGKCYLATDTKTKFQFCLKKMELVDFNVEEVCLWSKLEHKNIVTLYGALRHSNVIYLLTEYIDGGDLANCIEEHKKRGERLSHWLAVKYFQQLLNVILYLESQNLLHEDIKADNILLRANCFSIVLTDFGLCSLFGKPEDLKDKVPCGTVTHFSPEKAASLGHGFPAAVWACVCVLVHMLSGQQPWQKYLKKLDYLNFTIYMKPPPLEDVPDNIRAVVKNLIAKGFTKEPEQRPNARMLLQHEAFNIINHESETYFSTLGSGIVASKAAVLKETTKDVEAKEKTVSLYEISFRCDQGVRVQSHQPPPTLESSAGAFYRSVMSNMAGCDSTPMAETSETQRLVDVPSPMQEVFDREAVSNTIVMGDKCSEVPEKKGALNDHGRVVQDLSAGKIARLDKLLSLPNDSGDVPRQPQGQLEVFRPHCAAQTDLPLLSSFEKSWSKESKTELSIMNNSSVSEGAATGCIRKKAPDLMLNVSATQCPPLMRPQSQRSTNSGSSSQGSSLFFPGSAPVKLEDQDKQIEELRRGMMGSKPNNDFFRSQLADEDEIPMEAQLVDEDKTEKVTEVLKILKSSITELDGHKVTLYNEEKEELFPVRIPDKDKNRPCKELISVFKAKVLGCGIQHFDLFYLNGAEVNYNCCLEALELMVIANPDTTNCWCASCQY